MKVGMIGSRDYQNKKKIKDLIFKLKSRFGNDLEIVGDGNRMGVGLHVKKACIELGVDYSEFPPLHEQWNHNCPEPAYMYGKPYSPKYYPMRNTQIVEYSDMIIGFVVSTEKEKHIVDVNTLAKKKNKEMMILR